MHDFSTKPTECFNVTKSGVIFLLSGDAILQLLINCLVCCTQVSVSCGIPDFRSRGGIYSRLALDFPDLPDPQSMFDIQYFRQDPRPFFKFAREIYPGQFSPSPCHRSVAVEDNVGSSRTGSSSNMF